MRKQLSVFILIASSILTLSVVAQDHAHEHTKEDCTVDSLLEHIEASEDVPSEIDQNTRMDVLLELSLMWG